MNNLSLKITLIDALAKLHKYTENQCRIKDIIHTLSHVNIPNNDYGKVIYFIYILAQENPEILSAYPHNKLLRKLSLYCIKNLS